MSWGLLMAARFGERLKELRERAGFTQEALARAADMSVSAVSKLEQRDLDPAWSTVQAFARVLGVRCDAFTIEAEPTSPEPAPAKKPAPKRGRK